MIRGKEKGREGRKMEEGTFACGLQLCSEGTCFTRFRLGIVCTGREGREKRH